MFRLKSFIILISSGSATKAHVQSLYLIFWSKHFFKNTSKYFSLKTWFSRRYDVLNHYEFQMEAQYIWIILDLIDHSWSLSGNKLSIKMYPKYINLHYVKHSFIFLMKTCGNWIFNGSRNNESYMIYSLRSKKFNTLKTEMTL